MTKNLFDPTAWPLRQAYEAFQAEAKALAQQMIEAQEKVAPLEGDWRLWLPTLFPDYVKKPFARRHKEFWDWVWSIEKEKPIPAFVAIWPRGGAKSTSAEMACIAVGARKVRSYIWYLSETQDQADKHVETIASMLESPEMEEYYPDLARRETGKYGHSKGWRRQRLWTAGGLVIDAIGLDTAQRGVKLKEQRPDFIVIDDIDSLDDSPKAVKKKIERLTQSLLPAGTSYLAVLAVQNLIHEHSIFNMFAEGTAEFLLNRTVSGPHPAVVDLNVERGSDGRYRITGGRATWAGQSLEDCQAIINTSGLTSFLRESQHDIEPPPGGIWDHVQFVTVPWSAVPELVRGCVWVDPAVTETDESDCHAIQADGLGVDDRIYRFYSWERVTSPEDSLQRAILKAVELGFEVVGVETDQGGDTWESVYERAWETLVNSPDHPQISHATPKPRFMQAKAGQGHGSKVHRNQLMLADYERGAVRHVEGTSYALERALRRFPKTKPLDLADAAYWGWRYLRGEDQPKKPASGKAKVVRREEMFQ